MLGVLRVDELVEDDPFGGKKVTRLYYSLADAIDPCVIALPSPDLATHAQKTQRSTTEASEESADLRADTDDSVGPAKSGDGAELPLMSICAICGERMIVYEPGQTTHPNCEGARDQDR